MTDADTAPPPAAGSRLRAALLPILVLAVLALCAYANSFRNRALAHHQPNVYVDPLLESPMLRTPRLFGKIFSEALLLTTYGEYRPVGYALFTLVNSVMPETAERPWRLILLVLHLVTAVILFFLLRPLAEPATATALAALYLLHPLLTPFTNDVNMIHVLWGLLLCALTLFLYARHLRTQRAWPLLLSLMAFAASLFTIRHALVLPGLLLTLCLFQKSHPRATLALLVYLTLGAVAAAMFQAPALGVLVGMCITVFIATTAVPPEKREVRRALKTLPPYVALGAFCVLFPALAPNVAEPSLMFANILHVLAEGGWSDPFQPWFLLRTFTRSSPLHLTGLIVAALVPVTFLLRRRLRLVALTAAAALAFVATAKTNAIYRTDVTYWKSLDRLVRAEIGQQTSFAPTQYHLADAYLSDRNYEAARDILMRLHYSAALTEFVDSKLARAFAGLGNDKVAGYYFFYFDKFSWYAKVMKHRLDDIADFCLRTGYVSCAEHHWACALVLDPNDLRVYNNLGRALVYKNFFRGAARHFRHVLSLDPHNETALYHLAFIGLVLEDTPTYDDAHARWKRAAASVDDIDFRKLYDGYNSYRFDRDKMIAWFSGEPMTMFQRLGAGAKDGGPADRYRVTFQGTDYRFPEVPLEVGKHFARTGDHAAALRHFLIAHEVDPDFRQPVAELVAVCRSLCRYDDVDRFERLLEKMPHGEHND